MNPNINKLYEIANKKERRIIGLMSGTSLDGLDVALCTFTGNGTNTEFNVLQFSTVPYTEEMRTKIRKVFAQKTIDLQHLCALNAWIGTLHGQMILDCLSIWKISPETIDIIASHGQTVFHNPKAIHLEDEFGNSTLQIGDGDHIAIKTGIITLSDFRQKHIAAGGEGGPLAIYGDYLLFSTSSENRIMLNIGGIANFTWLPKSKNAWEVFSSDIGPGNTLLDCFSRKLFNMEYDKNSQFAKEGTVSFELLNELLSHEYYSAPFPKTTGPETFNDDYVEQALKKCDTITVSHKDIMATLTMLTAETIAQAVNRVISVHNIDSLAIYLSGGGAHNPLLVESIRNKFLDKNYVKIQPMSTLGVSGDAKEALLFAILANETLCGGNVRFDSGKGIPSVTMGKISFPF